MKEWISQVFHELEEHGDFSSKRTIFEANNFYGFPFKQTYVLVFCLCVVDNNTYRKRFV
ncbi:hypothetical protein QUF88_19700 [Bacillus sp. DX1.1]|uniref:hypothetical protein n=1 Tax=unclassified Bacillus (in: firmicutes) TaxID=185979 RepID=UPI0025711DB0|nr:MULTISPECIES: hypothetical protein [unclassified Bacillus (in: firmicutes)]MDM5155936.1 hypothetical protein [Bacillus sp. DX1.1]WJE84203.1 hypothetical protein QRE67_17230 [Bacillus sp. DX3.1]